MAAIRKTKIWAVVVRKNGYVYGMYFTRSRARIQRDSFPSKVRELYKVTRATLSV